LGFTNLAQETKDKNAESGRPAGRKNWREKKSKKQSGIQGVGHFKLRGAEEKI